MLIAPSGARGTGQHGELMPQQRVLEHEILARANAGQDRRQEQPEQFKHVLSIADLRSREVVPPHTRIRHVQLQHQEGSGDGQHTIVAKAVNLANGAVCTGTVTDQPIQ